MTCLFTALATAAFMQAVSVGQSSTPAVVQWKRTTREELRRLIHENGIVIARERLHLLDVVGQGLPLSALLLVSRLELVGHYAVIRSTLQILWATSTRCSAIAERPRCRVCYSFRQK